MKKLKQKELTSKEAKSVIKGGRDHAENDGIPPDNAK